MFAVIQQHNLSIERLLSALEMSLESSSLTPLPLPDIRNLEDGTVEIKLGAQLGWVSSMHLVEPKVNQLYKAYLESNVS